MEVVGNFNKAMDIDVKRLRLPGIKLRGKCPSCLKGVEFDLGGDDYIYYPTANRQFNEGLYCTKCSHEWTVPLRINLSLEVVE